MDNHFAKFAFLAVVVSVVLFSRMAYPAASPTAYGDRSDSSLADQNKVPLFVFPQTTVSADGQGAAASAPAAAPDPVTAPANGPAVSAPAVFSRTGSAQAPALQSTASLVADLTTGTVYESTNADRRWPTASIAKLMASTIVADKLDPGMQITVTEGMFAQDPSEATLVVGGTYTVTDLLHMMLMPSSNVAAEAVASFYGRGSFIDEMNSRAAAWGMKNTYFGDPSGISSSDQSTANDLLKLAQKIYADYPQIFTVTRTAQFTLTEQHSGAKMAVRSINDFAGSADFIGGKTGHTNEAQGNLLSLFRYEGRPIAVIVLGTDARFNDTQKLRDWFEKNFK